MDDEYGGLDMADAKLMNRSDSDDDLGSRGQGPEFNQAKKPSFSTNPIPKKIVEEGIESRK